MIYKLSPNEAERVVKNEIARKRVLRILAVREQSKKNSEKLLRSVHNEQERLFNDLVKSLKNKWNTENEKLILETEKIIAAKLMEVGESHRNAFNSNYIGELEARLIEFKSNQEKANERFKTAIAERRKHSDDKVYAQNKHIIDRFIAVEIERQRAAFIASLPKPPMDPIDDLNLEQITKRSEHSKSSVETKVEKNTNGEDAALKAAETEQDAEKRFEEKQKQILEQRQKAIERHNMAMNKQLAVKECENVLKDLCDLQKAEVNEKRLNSNLFSMSIGKNKKEMQEKKFENIYAKSKVGTNQLTNSNEWNEFDNSASGDVSLFSSSTSILTDHSTLPTHDKSTVPTKYAQKTKYSRAEALGIRESVSIIKESEILWENTSEDIQAAVNAEDLVSDRPDMMGSRGQIMEQMNACETGKFPLAGGTNNINAEFPTTGMGTSMDGEFLAAGVVNNMTEEFPVAEVGTSINEESDQRVFQVESGKIGEGIFVVNDCSKLSKLKDKSIGQIDKSGQPNQPINLNETPTISEGDISHPITPSTGGLSDIENRALYKLSKTENSELSKIGLPSANNETVNASISQNSYTTLSQLPTNETIGVIPDSGYAQVGKLNSGDNSWHSLQEMSINASLPLLSSTSSSFLSKQLNFRDNERLELLKLKPDDLYFRLSKNNDQFKGNYDAIELYRHGNGVSNDSSTDTASTAYFNLPDKKENFEEFEEMLRRGNLNFSNDDGRDGFANNLDGRVKRGLNLRIKISAGDDNNNDTRLDETHLGLANHNTANSSSFKNVQKNYFPIVVGGDKMDDSGSFNKLPKNNIAAKVQGEKLFDFLDDLSNDGSLNIGQLSFGNLDLISTPSVPTPFSLDISSFVATDDEAIRTSDDQNFNKDHQLRNNRLNLADENNQLYQGNRSNELSIDQIFGGKEVYRDKLYRDNGSNLDGNNQLYSNNDSDIYKYPTNVESNSERHFYRTDSNQDSASYPKNNAANSKKQYNENNNNSNLNKTISNLSSGSLTGDTSRLITLPMFVVGDGSNPDGDSTIQNGGSDRVGPPPPHQRGNWTLGNIILHHPYIEVSLGAGGDYPAADPSNNYRIYFDDSSNSTTGARSGAVSYLELPRGGGKFGKLLVEKLPGNIDSEASGASSYLELPRGNERKFGNLLVEKLSGDVNSDRLADRILPSRTAERAFNPSDENPPSVDGVKVNCNTRRDNINGESIRKMISDNLLEKGQVRNWAEILRPFQKIEQPRQSEEKGILEESMITLVSANYSLTEQDSEFPLSSQPTDRNMEFPTSSRSTNEDLEFPTSFQQTNHSGRQDATKKKDIRGWPNIYRDFETVDKCHQQNNEELKFNTKTEPRLRTIQSYSFGKEQNYAPGRKMPESLNRAKIKASQVTSKSPKVKSVGVVASRKLIGYSNRKDISQSLESHLDMQQVLRNWRKNRSINNKEN